MAEFRLKALETYNKLELPTWGPDLSELNMDEIATYVRPKSKMADNWEDVPEEIKDTFDKLGIPEAEKRSLAGVGAQYDSEVVYHSMKKRVNGTRRNIYRYGNSCKRISRTCKTSFYEMCTSNRP